MQRLLKIGAVASVGYFLILPILFALHFLQHESASAHLNHPLPGDFSVLTEFEETCDFCDLFYENHLEAPTLPALSSHFHSLLQTSSILNEFLIADATIIHLRGPPIQVSNQV